jgi:energy-coupling factor transporter ATP-binding protein EcfA2
MRLRRLTIERSKSCGGLFDGSDVWFGRDGDGKSNEPLAPLCLIGPNGSGKSQFLQLVAEIFQAAWHEHAPEQERISANDEVLFELTYLISADGRGEPEEVKLVRKLKGRKPGHIELYRGEDGPILAKSQEFGRYLPSVVVGYTSGATKPSASHS